MYLTKWQQVHILIFGILILIFLLVRLHGKREKERVYLKLKSPRITRDEEGDQLYKSVLDDIRFIKSQQWKVANYCLLIYGFLIYLTTNRICTEIGMSFVSFLLSISVFDFGTFLIVNFQFNLRASRFMLSKFGPNLHREAHYWERENYDQRLNRDEGFWRDGYITILLILANSIGFVFSLWFYLAKL